MIEKGFSFIIHDGHHEPDQIYKINCEVRKDCTCPEPWWLTTDRQDHPNKPHTHFTAICTAGPEHLKGEEFIFGFYDYNTLTNVRENHENDKIEIMEMAQSQLSLF